MNPGYAGRTELPESVKALFRPDLAKKVTALYRLAKEQLSQQHHYDFGLRALRSLLVMAGVIRRKNPNLREDQLLMRALRDSNIPKLVHEDVPLFMGLIQDLFPGIEFEAAQMIAELVEASHAVLEHLQYTIVEEQVVKIVQLHETLHYRHSVMVVGPTCGGKSVVLEVYVRALKQLGTNSKMYTINPKDRSVNDLYGYLEPTSREWIDGLLSYLFRLINQFTDAAERRFLLFDGDVDALWIENMNSVMDDNKLLTLVNGERIRLQPYCSLLFEVADLQYASPATVSRCGMVYVDPTNLGYTPYWQSWVSGVPMSMQNTLNNLFKKYVGVIMDYIFDGILPPSIGRQMTAVPQIGEERNKGRQESGGMGIGGGGMGIAGKESGASSGTSKLKLVLPLVKMNLIVQFCTLLQTQLELGGHPGMEKTEIEVTQCLDIENAQESVKFSMLEKALPPLHHGSMSPSVHGSTQQQMYQPSSSLYGATPSLSQALSQGLSHDSNNEVTIDNPDVLESVFLFSLCWAFSGVVSAADQRTFDNLIKILSSLPQMDEGPGEQPARP
ncbi:ATPase family protein, partial [Opisthorchis viverrini]